MGSAVVLETLRLFQRCLPSACAQRVAASKMGSFCLASAGAEPGNWSHAKDTVSHPAGSLEAVSLLPATLPIFQQLPARALFASPFAPAQPATNPALVRLLIWLAAASPPARNPSVTGKSSAKPAPASKAPARNLSLCPDRARQLVTNQSAVTVGPASHPALR